MDGKVHMKARGIISFLRYGAEGWLATDSLVGIPSHMYGKGYVSPRGMTSALGVYGQGL